MQVMSLVVGVLDTYIVSINKSGSLDRIQDGACSSARLYLPSPLKKRNLQNSVVCTRYADSQPDKLENITRLYALGCHCQSSQYDMSCLPYIYSTMLPVTCCR